MQNKKHKYSTCTDTCTSLQNLLCFLTKKYRVTLNIKGNHNLYSCKI